MAKSVQNLKKKELLVTVEHVGRIPPLYQDGPILHPLRVSTSIALKLISGNYPVYEHNPYNPKERIRLNLLNVMADNFEPVIPEVLPSLPETGDDVPEIKSVVIPSTSEPNESDPKSSHDDSSEAHKPEEGSETDEPVDSSAEHTETTDPESESSETSEHDPETPEEQTHAATAVMSLNTEAVLETATTVKNIPLSQQAAELGIDTTGMSRNKIRKAIEEARKAQEEGETE